MEKINSFVRKSLIGGMLVVLPIAIFFIVFRWLFFLVTDLIQPLTDWLVPRLQLPELVADGIVVVLLVLACFLIGTLVSTGIGKWLHLRFDGYLTRLAPGYRIIKEIIGQFMGDPESSPFSKGEVVRVRLFGAQSPTTVTAITTSRNSDGTMTIFMPTGPNPTSGNIYHVPEELVEVIHGATVESMMRSIIACGAGSDKLFQSKAG
ncbi:DUF502 domain-containing protein [Pleionea sediminis]|uniref:DUF502 domain-containing protein n=1 Tax=Pleionea sediminis TaxID=2569479 RepID=UPI0011857BCC|nr:DUF502 domain-containing protein [Pleionea sediminis]